MSGLKVENLFLKANTLNLDKMLMQISPHFLPSISELGLKSPKEMLPLSNLIALVLKLPQTDTKETLKIPSVLNSKSHQSDTTVQELQSWNLQPQTKEAKWKLVSQLRYTLLSLKMMQIKATSQRLKEIKQFTHHN